MRLMLDTMIFDYVVDDASLTEAVSRAIDTGRVTIVTTHIQEDQIAAIPDDDAKKAAISRIPRVTVRTTGVALGVWRLGMANFADDETNATLERMGQRHLKNTKDAIIAASARDEADAVVTNDDTLQRRIRRLGLKVRVLTFEEFQLLVSTPAVCG